MKSKSLNARGLRLLLFLLLLATMGLTAGGFYFAQNTLRDYASKISVLNAEADSGDKDLQTLKNIEARLDSNKQVAEKARDIVAESKEYVYQDKIVEDINSIARQAGVTVTNFSFSETTAASGAATTPQTQTPATGTATTPQAPTSQATATGTVNSKQVTVTVQSPITYTQAMGFITRIEQNPLKMQLASIAMAAGDGNTVSTESFVIKVYVR